MIKGKKAKKKKVFNVDSKSGARAAKKFEQRKKKRKTRNGTNISRTFSFFQIFFSWLPNFFFRLPSSLKKGIQFHLKSKR